MTRRVHERHHYSPSSLARSERNLAALEVDGVPGEFRQVTEPLSKIQAEKHKRAPVDLGSARFQNAFNFRQRERAPCRLVVRFQDGHAGGWIDRQQALPDGLAKADAQDFQTEIGSRAGKFFWLTNTKLCDVHGLQRGKVAVGLCSDTFDEPLDDASVTRVRGLLRFD